MSVSPSHGRRRAAVVSPAATRRELRNTTAPATRRFAGFGPIKRMAVVAVAGALVAGAGLAQTTATPQLTPVATQESTGESFTRVSSGVSAPDDVAISFAGVAVGSVSAAAKAAELKAQAAALGPVDDPAAAKAFAATAVAARGWGAEQMTCLTLLWERESNWRTSAENPSSGAYGIAQSLPATKMESVDTDWATNAHTQITWGLTYIAARYVTPCGAWAHSEAVNWY